MKKIILLLIVLSISIIFISCSVFSEDNKDIQVKKQPEIQQVKSQKPVKIKLKRLADGKYTWDLTGDDVDEIVTVDRRLKKLLKSE
jgi:translation elongation factor P/translation initiation factor 5A